MQTVRWLSFCISNAVTRSVVHFFPASVNVAGPYAAQCKLSLFGKDIERKSVVLEGARFGQPDGFRLDDVFPQLQEGTSGFFGLEFELSTTQPRTDLSASTCVIELSSRGQSCRFWPRRYIQDTEPSPRSALIPRTAATRSPLALKDPFSASSLVIVNGTAEAFSPKFLQRRPSAESEPSLLSLDSLAPATVVEFDVSELATVGQEPVECSWGLVRAAGLWLSEPLPEGAVAYMMYRDVVTRRPVSVAAL
ncbi:MAG: hypothetical protein J0M12_08305 [Deltaproteobacteria bacterium]|nr:hypothetical protein [Deltaproteobacteria bacterium]